MTWIRALSQQPPVKAVANLRIVGNKSRSVREGFAILKSNGLRIIAILAKGLVGLWCEPLGPCILNMVDWVVDSGSGEALNINWPNVMVSHGCKYGNVRTSKELVDFFGD